jgi:pyruvate kinase
MRKTKILATLGPASDSEEVIQKLVEAGADAFRFNFSHATHEQHLIAYHRVRAVSEKLGKPIGAVMDLQGPKVRVGVLEGDQVLLTTGAEVLLTSRKVKGDSKTIPVVYGKLEEDVKPGEIILMDDGRLRFRVEKVTSDGVVCSILEGGLLKNHKGVNFPGSALQIPSLTNKDLEDLAFGMKLGFDCVALSFVSKASDVLDLREHMKRLGAAPVPIMSKLERAACLNDLPGIIDASDAVMVARGDLGVEVDIKRVPVLQKEIITQANLRGIPVVTATQMLESMTNGLLPTRAEAADVANAVLDGADTLMLSGETSVGLYPAQSVKMMNDIIMEAESFISEQDRWMRQPPRRNDIGEAVCHTAVVAAHDLGLENIVVITTSGRTALDIAKFRPRAEIQAFTFNKNVLNFLALSRGVCPHLSEYTDDFEHIVNLMDDYLVEKGIAKTDEIVGVVLGVPIYQHKSTNTLTIHRVGRKMLEGN